MVIAMLGRLFVVIVLVVRSQSQQFTHARTQTSLSFQNASGVPTTVFNMWLPNEVEKVLDELWILNSVFLEATGRRLVPVAAADPETALFQAEVILVSVFGSRDSVISLVKNHSHHAVIIYIAGENTETRTGHEDHLIDIVHLSFGHRVDLLSTNYLRIPWWLPYTIQRTVGKCMLPATLIHSVSAESWMKRPGYAALLSSHYAFPRPQLFELLSTLGNISSPGKAFHNMDWPANWSSFHSSPDTLRFLRNYKFSICPENSKTRSNGYNTEKLPRALIAGCVPIYWGDSPIDAQVFNPSRYILYDGFDNETLLRTVGRLIHDDAFRNAFFEEPVLQPGAQKWVAGWCRKAASLVRNSFCPKLSCAGKSSRSRFKLL